MGILVSLLMLFFQTNGEGLVSCAPGTEPIAKWHWALYDGVDPNSGWLYGAENVDFLYFDYDEQGRRVDVWFAVLQQRIDYVHVSQGVTGGAVGDATYWYSPPVVPGGEPNHSPLSQGYRLPIRDWIGCQLPESPPTPTATTTPTVTPTVTPSTTPTTTPPTPTTPAPPTPTEPPLSVDLVTLSAKSNEPTPLGFILISSICLSIIMIKIGRTGLRR